MKFSQNLVIKILSGEKTCTWRLWDDKDFKKGDIVTFIRRPELTVFAKAELTTVVEKRMDEVTSEDELNVGHEPYEDNLKAYSEYYGRQVLPDTLVKVIRFRLITS